MSIQLKKCPFWISTVSKSNTKKIVKKQIIRSEAKFQRIAACTAHPDTTSWPEIKSFFEVSINGDQVQAIVQRHQHADDYPVAQQVAQHDLEITEADGPYIPRNADERNAGKRRADHPEGNQIPGWLPVGCEKSRGVSPAGGD